jgi:class 3 adenylate cyclase/pimeloyl-ACP methyl ester carboxylesterase
VTVEAGLGDDDALLPGHGRTVYRRLAEGDARAQDALMIPETRYAKTADGVYLAYQAVGDGPVDIAWQFDFFGNVDLCWEQPLLGDWLRGLASFSRLILHDRRATGLSSRNVAAPNLETRIADLRVVLDAVESDRPVLAGFSEAGALGALFAASIPDRVSALAWWSPSGRSTWAPDYPWGVRPAYVEAEQRAMEDWGTMDFSRGFAEMEATEGQIISDERARANARYSRHTATPDVALQLSRIWYETDVRGALPAVRVPALLLAWDSPEGWEEAKYVASLMPNAELTAMAGLAAGTGGTEVTEATIDAALEEVRRFVGLDRPPPELTTVLSTILFTDIVGSTQKQASLGDRAWKDLIERHHGIVREALARWRGVENDTAGDGFYATFEGPARAIRCAQEVAERVPELGIEIRAGVHTGECEVIEDKCGGLTVSIGARVAALAGPSEVLVSQTVKDLVAGSGLSFEDAGEHELKGVPDRWRLYRVVGQ